MPFLRIETNADIPDAAAAEIMTRLSQVTADSLGKSEDYVMVSLQPVERMLHGGSNGPCAFIVLKSIGLDDSRTGTLSDAICSTIGELLGIPPERIYIEFSGPPGSMWGWNRRTF